MDYISQNSRVTRKILVYLRQVSHWLSRRGCLCVPDRLLCVWRAAWVGGRGELPWALFSMCALTQIAFPALHHRICSTLLVAEQEATYFHSSLRRAPPAVSLWHAAV